jgi:hypothetical protein
MTMHTPGPWKLGQYLGSLRQFVIHMDVGDKGRGSDVAFTSTAFGNDETIANARLIAAAPDLLEALQWYEAKAVQMGRAAIDQDSKLLLELMKEIAVEYGAQARAAIAKATGEQP